MGKAFVDLTGKRFGRWTVINRADDYVDKFGHRFTAWDCVCDCGNKKVVIGGNLVRGKSQSCGCMKNELHKARCNTEKTTVKYKSLDKQPSLETMLKVMLGEEYETTDPSERKDKAIQSVFYNCWFKFVRDEQTVIRRYKREHPTCEICGKECETVVHHKRPVSDYGGNEPENLMWICKECHREIERERAKNETKMHENSAR